MEIAGSRGSSCLYGQAQAEKCQRACGCFLGEVDIKTI